MWKQLLWIAFAGSLGTLARYSLAGLVQRWAGGSFPWGTLVVNVIGCFLFGFVWTLAEDRFAISNSTRLVVLTGFMGAFTTFSTFAFETEALLRESQWIAATANLLANNLLGVMSVVAGLALGRWFYV